MAKEAEEAKGKPTKKAARSAGNEKPVSLHPLSLEEAVDRLLKVQPESHGKLAGPSSRARRKQD